MRLAAALILTLVLVPGCARNNYLTNRGGDLVDIVRGHVLFGPAVGAKVEVTRVLQLGAVYQHRAFAAGLHNRALGVWRQSIWSWGLLVGYHDEMEIEGEGVDYVSGSYGWTFGGAGDEGGGTFQDSGHGGALDLFVVRGTLALVVGADLEIRFGELIDFLAGIFQFDPAGDDRDYEGMRRADLPDDEEGAEASEG